MQFKYPELLYLLCLILIPILVHLFQLQKFKKKAFSNVAFLQKIVSQNRKSSTLKRWLILSIRITLFSFIIFAFSQPYIGSKKLDSTTQTFIYLDNSLSLNAKGKNGNLLQNSIKEIINNSSEKETYNLLTNTSFYKKINSNQLKNTLLNIRNEAKSYDFNSVLLKFDLEKKEETNTLYNEVLISDFQNTNKPYVTNVKSKIQLIQTQPTKRTNLSIDSLHVFNEGNSNYNLEVIIRNQGASKNNIPIALYNNDIVFAKQTFSIKENSKKSIYFPILNQSQFNGKINIKFNDVFNFDNQFYFTINPAKKTTVFCLGKKTDFLSKIYSKNEFIFNSNSLKNIDYNFLQKQELIILNELEIIPKTLANFLVKHIQQNKSLVIIPSSNTNLNSYNYFLDKNKIGVLKKLTKDSVRITKINFQNPFFKNIFSKTVTNFQYPISKNYFKNEFKNSNALIQFENQHSFVEQIRLTKGKLYWFNSAINLNNSNFQNSPLIVPLFYKFGKLSSQIAKPYYTVYKRNLIDISIKLKKDEVITINNSDLSFIPLQQSYPEKVRITLENSPKKPGFFSVQNKNIPVTNLAFNIDKEESNLSFFNVKEFAKNHKNISFSNSVTDILNRNAEKNKVTWLWKWFLALAIVSLVFEILILKFFKL